ncbi:uncharacterized protein Z519_10557 [Cladophialophora bantiana CBS 173.52]|uniref:Uncharacterized protein n=1 Tax=Cladophialophora bantiana (strain ATCC 10958 / CBS 173.52 / CDC B-1940 / NIH 8579) TaxID=1442370 RepID=A0A0D2FR63_CLAB1|nr:uncharacterized protein Z519_10557 [Cladophialophora bantiana CBS 173.52]KIW89072.1 hypothetical protein Z519_10557 [Cladophialophora bantiana CBS 173.52]
MASAFAFLESPNRGVPDRRHSTEHLRMTSPSLSRNSSNASSSSRTSEPGWFSAIYNMDRSRASSVPVHSSTKSSSRGFSRLFSRGGKKEKKDMDQIILTSRHASSVKTKLALDPRYKNVYRESAPAQQPGGAQNLMHVSAGEQEIRRPHSGPPSLHGIHNKPELPALTRIISGDEADEPDEREKMRYEWRQRKVPTLETNIIEGEVLDNQVSGQLTPAKKDKKNIGTPPSELDQQDVRILSVATVSDGEYQPRPARVHIPIGGRWKRDENGVWKR